MTNRIETPELTSNTHSGSIVNLFQCHIPEKKNEVQVENKKKATDTLTNDKCHFKTRNDPLCMHQGVNVSLIICTYLK